MSDIEWVSFAISLGALFVAFSTQYLVALWYSIQQSKKETKKQQEEIEALKRSERILAENWYELADCCASCVHKQECNTPGAWVEDEEGVPKEKCIEGIIAYAHSRGGKDE